MKTAWKIIRTSLKYSINTLHFIRTMISNIILLIFIVSIIGVYLSFQHAQCIPNQAALVLDLTGVIVDKPATYNKFQKISKHLFNINQYNIQENSLFDIINILRQAKTDPNITGLILILKHFIGGHQSSLEYVGKALFEFKNSGKPIYAISDYYNQSQYFLASYANKIYLTPQGSVDLRGISTDKLYYQSLFNQLKINTHIFRAGEYKSAVEPFVRNNMSDQVRQEENVWVNKLWNQYLKTIAFNRNTTIQEIFPGIQHMLNDLTKINGDTANYALQKKWIDEILPSFMIENTMKKIFGDNKDGTSFNSVSMYDYNIIKPLKCANQIAVICIQGSIIDGENSSENIGGNTIAHIIRNARYDPKVKAVVLRVNSPGGSVTASELIRMEIMAIRNSGKPVVVSMGNIAASGGYWISTPANFIIGSNSTITGSIGVFGVINTFEKSLDSIGIHSDGINTSPIANISATKKLPTEFQNIMQLYVDTSYQYFIKTVAHARYKNIVDINHISQGHIWLGCDAVKNGLIDKIGDFDDAIHKAAKLANLTEYELNWYENKVNWMNFILKQTSNIINYFIVKFIHTHICFIDFDQSQQTFYKKNNIKSIIWNDPKHCYALCLDQTCLL